MTKKHNLLFWEDAGYARLTIVDNDYGFERRLPELETMCAHPGHYVRIDDFGQPQLCAGGQTRGNTLIWANDGEFSAQLARDCDARLFKTRAGYDRAVAKIDPDQED